MKRAMKWIGIVVTLGIAGAVTYEVVQRTRQRLRTSLDHVDRITEKAKDLVDETHSTLHAAKQAV